MAGVDVAKLADFYNLSESEAVWAGAQIAAGLDVDTAVLQIRAQRIGPASDPSYRPLSAAAAADLGVELEDDGEPVAGDGLEPDDTEDDDEDEELS